MLMGECGVRSPMCTHYFAKEPPSGILPAHDDVLADATFCVFANALCSNCRTGEWSGLSGVFCGDVEMHRGEMRLMDHIIWINLYPLTNQAAGKPSQ